MVKRRRRVARKTSSAIRRVAITPAVHTLDVFSVGLAFGTAWGLGVLCVAILAMFLNYGTPLVSLISSVYLGFEATGRGAIIGAIWGFIDAFVGGILVAWLYNVFQRLRH